MLAVKHQANMLHKDLLSMRTTYASEPQLHVRNFCSSLSELSEL